MADASADPQISTYECRMQTLAHLVESAEIVAVYCLDLTYAPVPMPPEINQLGFGDIRATDHEHRLVDLVEPAYFGEVAGALTRAKRTGSSSCDIRLSDLDNHQPGKEISVRLFNFHEEFGLMVVVIGKFVDGHVDEPMSAPTELRTRRLVFTNSRKGRYLTVDPKTPSMLGWLPEEMQDKAALDFIHPDDHDRVIEGWLKVLAGDDGARQRQRMMTKDRGWLWVESTYTRDALADAAPGGGHVVVEFLDVEDEMQALASARMGASQFETLAKSVPVGVVQLDANGSLVFVNDWVRETTGLDTHSQDRMGRWDAVHPEDRTRAAAAIEGSISGEAADFDVRLKRSGSSDYLLCRIRSQTITVDGSVQGVIASIEDVTESVSLQERLRVEANTDYLTGLPNRAALTRELQLFIDTKAGGAEKFACLFIDLDGFKLVNDGLGHGAGDLLLKAIGGRLQAVVRPTDIVARVGGDEFVVLCPWASELEEVTKLADRLMEVVQAPIPLGEGSVNVGVSIGIAIHDGSDTSADVIISNADLAMYEAKRPGGGRWSIYGDELRDSMQQRFDLQSSMHRAIENREFRMHLQPLWDLHTDTIVSAEALIRWEHPTRGLIPPGYFIDFVAESDLMIPLGWWIIDDSCRIAAQVTATGFTKFSVGVNVTGRQLSEPGFADRFLSVVKSHGLQPFNVILEVTETVWIDNGPQVSGTLEALAAAGTAIALDDFGTGYSSLNHLRDMPVKTLKIDRSYTGRIETCAATRAIVESVKQLGDKLNLGIVVEGIETEEQKSIVLEMGLRYAQGYLMARPMDEATFLENFVRTSV